MREGTGSAETGKTFAVWGEKDAQLTKHESNISQHVFTEQTGAQWESGPRLVAFCLWKVRVQTVLMTVRLWLLLTSCSLGCNSNNNYSLGWPRFTQLALNWSYVIRLVFGFKSVSTLLRFSQRLVLASATCGLLIELRPSPAATTEPLLPALKGQCVCPVCIFTFYCHTERHLQPLMKVQWNNRRETYVSF